MLSKIIYPHTSFSSKTISSISGDSPFDPSYDDADLDWAKVHPEGEQDHRRHRGRHQALRPHQGHRQDQVGKTGH